ncbi:MAG: ABC transporter permease, partial [Gemmatimonadales bacterium]
MTERPDGLPDRLDRLEAERRARAAGLPAELAERVAEVVSGSGLSEDRRSEVFRELVAHFEDGLTAGRSPAELAASFGDGNEAARMIRSEKRTVTPPELGGSGRSDGWMTRIGRDIRYAARRLLARPAFTAIALASLAVGIGANAAMFTVVNEVILRRPPVKEPERLINIYRSTADNQFEVLTYPDYRDLTRLTDVFESVMVARMGATIRQDGDRADRLVIQLVSGNYFEGLGVRSGAGRLIQPSDAPAPGEGTAVVLTDSYWNRAFGRSPAAIGQTVRLAGSVFTIVGVAPPGFAGAFPSIGIDLFAPVTALETVMPPSGDEFETRSNYAYFVQARLGAGVSVPQALAALGGLAASNREQHVTGWTGQESYTVLPSREVLLYPPIDRLLKPVALVMM